MFSVGNGAEERIIYQAVADEALQQRLTVPQYARNLALLLKTREKAVRGLGHTQPPTGVQI